MLAQSQRRSALLLPRLRPPAAAPCPPPRPSAAEHPEAVAPFACPSFYLSSQSVLAPPTSTFALIYLYLKWHLHAHLQLALATPCFPAFSFNLAFECARGGLFCGLWFASFLPFFVLDFCLSLSTLRLRLLQL
eukprot:scaffold9330_cov117-Isochrysis_galbana.AAC.15